MSFNNTRLLCNNTEQDPQRDWCVSSKEWNYVVVCYNEGWSERQGLWRAGNAGNLAVATFIFQLVLIIIVNRIIMYAFRPLRIPRIAAEILGGIILGSSGIGHTTIGFDYLFPHRSLLTLETVAHLGLLFYMFLVGLEVDMKPVIQAPKKALNIVLAGFLLPFPVGYGLHYMFVGEHYRGGPAAAKFGPIFWGIALSTTNFPDLAQILEDLKLLHTEIGRTALSAAVITDVFTWALLITSVATVKDGQIYTAVFGSAFVIFCLFALRPALSWIITRKGNDDYSDYHVYFILAGVVACGYISDACGCHSIMGGFMLGLIMPKGELKKALMEKVEDFISVFMMPLFFLIIGLRTNRSDILGGEFGIAKIIGVLVLAFVAKIVSTFVAAVFVNKMTPWDGLAMGLLMNTKGMLSLIVIIAGRNVKVMTIQTFTMMVAALWFMTAAVGPILAFTCKFNKPSSKNQKWSLTSLEQSSELRILTCYHSKTEVTGIINLLDASNPTRQSPISVFAVHLIENVGRATAMLIVRAACRINGREDDKKQFDSSQNMAAAAFDGFKLGKEGVSVYPLTAVSSYTTMHEDICSLANEKRANLIILPFQSKPTVDSGIDHPNSLHFRNINKNVMEKSLCSVAVLVDRGNRPHIDDLAKLSSHVCHRFIMLFIGGPDDREALVYATRMSGNENVELTIMRFVVANKEEGDPDTDDIEKSVDDQCFEEFRRKTRNNPLVRLTEVVVSKGEEILKLIGTMEDEEYDLIIVGKRKEGQLRLKTTESLSEWSEYPELGPLGDLLVCSSFAANSWILVVQQGGGYTSSNQEQVEDSGKLKEQYGHMTWQPPQIKLPELAPFVSRTVECC